MNGRATGVGFPILFGAYLMYSNFQKSTVFSEGPQATYHSVMLAFGGFLVLFGVVFLYKNLR